MLCEYADLTDKEIQKVLNCFQDTGVDCIPSDFTFVVSDSVTNDSMPRDFIMIDKNGRGFIYFPRNTSSPAKRWRRIIEYISKLNDDFPIGAECRHLTLFRDNFELLRGFCECHPSCLDCMHINLPDFAQTANNDSHIKKAANNSANTNIDNNSNVNKKVSDSKKPKGPKYPVYTDKMLDAIRKAVADSDVDKRYADAWNGFTIAAESDGEWLRVDFTPKDGAPYSICAVTLPKAGSYSCAGEVKRVMKVINGNLTLMLTNDAVRVGSQMCLDEVKKQFNESSSWVVPSDLTDFVGDWTLNSYKSIIEDINEPIDAQQEFALSHTHNTSSGNVRISFKHGTDVIYNPRDNEFVDFDGNAAYTAKRIASIMENAAGYRAIKQIISDSGISPSNCKFRCENWEFNLVDVIVTTSAGEQKISIDTNTDSFVPVLAARLDDIREEQENRAKRENDAMRSSGLIGNIVTDAVIETVHINSRITSNTIVKLLRGLKVNRSYKDYKKTVYEGKLNLVPDATIQHTIDQLTRINVFDKHDVEGDYGWFTVFTIDDAKYEQYHEVLESLMQKHPNKEIAMANPSKWIIEVADDKKTAKTDNVVNSNVDSDSEKSSASNSDTNDMSIDMSNDADSVSTSNNSNNGETDEKTQSSIDKKNGKKDEKKDGETTSNNDTISDKQGDDVETQRFEDETKKITYLISHPAVLSFAWDDIHEWLCNVDESTVKYLSVMKKLEQVKPRKSLINKMLDAATGNDIKKAEKKAAKAAKESIKGKKKVTQAIPEHTIKKKTMRNGAVRYVVMSKNGKVLDDAQGYGFKSKDTAERCYSFKSSGNGKEVKKAENWWRQKNHRKALQSFDDEAFYAMKEGRHVLVSELEQILEFYGIDMKSIGIKPSMLIKGAENLISF